MRAWHAALSILAILPTSGAAAAEVRCMYGGQFYGPGAMSCQAGAQAQCVDGSWKMTGSRCADQAADPPGKEAQPGVVQPKVGAD
jgi:hypothetical protein